MTEDERAPQYLLGLHDELDAMGRYPHSILQTGVLLSLGLVFIVPGVAGVLAGSVVASLPWVLFGTLFAGPGIKYGLRTLDWYRRRKSLRHGIQLIHQRQLEREKVRPSTRDVRS